MEKIHGWMVKKEPVWIAGTELYVISYAGLVFGNDMYLIRKMTVFDQDSALEKM